jgi:DNA-directed RNA polymerase specialized sigma24 family protein
MGEEGELEAVVLRAAAGEEAAWIDLWTALEPRLEGLARQARVSGRLSQNEDDRRNIVVEVMARLRAADMRRLKLYLDARRQNPALAFVPWVTVVAKRVAIDYMRGHGDYVDRRWNRNPDSAPGAWVNLHTLPGDSRLVGGRPPVTNRGAAMTMLRYAYSELPADQLAALELWIVQHDYPEIAEELGLGDAAAAQRLVRAALERLRRHFRHQKMTNSGGPPSTPA